MQKPRPKAKTKQRVVEPEPEVVEEIREEVQLSPPKVSVVKEDENPQQEPVAGNCRIFIHVIINFLNDHPT